MNKIILDESLVVNLKKYLVTQPLGEVHDFIVGIKQDVNELFVKELTEYLLTRPAKSAFDLFYALKKNVSDCINAIESGNNTEVKSESNIEKDNVIKTDKDITIK